MNFEDLKAIAVLRGSRGMLVLEKYSPEILMGAGIVGVIGGAVLACRATIKAQEVVFELNKSKRILDEAKDLIGKDSYLEDENGEKIEYSLQDYQRDLTIVAFQGTVELVKLYLPAILVGGVGIAMLLQSRNILSKRNAGLIAAYKTLDEAYNKYRRRVREELGDDVDKYLRLEKRDEDTDLVVKVKDKKGKEVDFELTEEEALFVDHGMTQYAKFFDQSSPQWRPTNDANIFFLKAQQTNANVELQTRGHLFLNQVYDMLGLPRTSAGAIVGWVKDHGDDVVDFGIFNHVNDYNADYINGYNRESILLDFNVDGLIWDII